MLATKLSPERISLETETSPSARTISTQDVEVALMISSLEICRAVACAPALLVSRDAIGCAEEPASSVDGSTVSAPLTGDGEMAAGASAISSSA